MPLLCDIVYAQLVSSPLIGDPSVDEDADSVGECCFSLCSVQAVCRSEETGCSVIPQEELMALR